MKYVFSILCLFSMCRVVAQTVDSLVPTEDQALLSVIVLDMEENPRPKDKIIFQGKHSQLTFEGIADLHGAFSILLPEGDTYFIKIQGLGNSVDFDELSIPKQKGKISGEIAIRYRPARTFNLDDVHFETNKATLLPPSFASLDELAEVLLLKKDLYVEIAGHTDNVGDSSSNLLLSQKRADAVVKYLIQKGVPANQLTAKGYGESNPIADNNTQEGRRENRRTEARVL
ncbi:OmpA family protein [Aureispira sp. CCB-QB1]|uniref:OmpA family protein n=2 Tax=unclassified Aureispira TaxID=2649989 RepID=UPI0007C6BB22|nr:OmpA family protein [Aureispira sp. CCB-QB1]